MGQDSRWTVVLGAAALAAAGVLAYALFGTDERDEEGGSGGGGGEYSMVPSPWLPGCWSSGRNPPRTHPMLAVLVLSCLLMPQPLVPRPPLLCVRGELR